MDGGRNVVGFINENTFDDFPFTFHKFGRPVAGNVKNYGYGVELALYFLFDFSPLVLVFSS